MLNISQEYHEKFFKAYWFLIENHQWAWSNLDIDVVKTSPKSKRVVDKESENTLIQYWLEGGPYCDDEHTGELISCHDLRLDTGGSSFEEAVIKYAALVRKYYGSEETDMIYGTKISKKERAKRDRDLDKFIKSLKPNAKSISRKV